MQVFLYAHRPEGNMWLDTKSAAALLHVTVDTLRHGRSDRDDLKVPPHTKFADGKVRYHLASLMWWAKQNRRKLKWSALPLSVALGADGALAARGVRRPGKLRTRAGA